MRLIPLSKGKFTKVDNDDYKFLVAVKWYYSTGGYAVRTPRPFKKPKILSMHRVITGAPTNKQVDHINGDRLDNRRSNLRIVDEKFNHINIKTRTDNTSGHKGVSYRDDRNKWRARISVNKKEYALGHFDTKEEAIKVYKEASLLYHKEYARKETF